jgi:hypothetical protein
MSKEMCNPPLLNLIEIHLQDFGMQEVLPKFKPQQHEIQRKYSTRLNKSITKFR